MYKIFALFLFVALAIATPAPKPNNKDLKGSESIYYPGYYPGVYDPFSFRGGRSLYGVTPYSYNPIYDGYHPLTYTGFPYYW